MNFSDVFKSSFLEKQASFSITDVTLAFILAFAIGLFIFIVYKKTFTGVLYSSSFGISLMAMTLITTYIILAVTSNIILSLGMVGALSIVRFRTAVKEPLDIAYLFWAISAGIVLGAGLIPLAIIGSVFIGVIMIFFTNRNSTDTPYILILSCETDESEEKALSYVKSSTKKNLIKSKTVSRNGIEVTLEIRLLNQSAAFLNQLLQVNGVRDASLVSYNGEYMS